jgi:hypothetical protein
MANLSLVATFPQVRKPALDLSDTVRSRSEVPDFHDVAAGNFIRAPRTMPVSTRDWLSVQMMAVFERDFPPGWLSFVHLTPLS